MDSVANFPGDGVLSGFYDGDCSEGQNRLALNFDGENPFRPAPETIEARAAILRDITASTPSSLAGRFTKHLFLGHEGSDRPPTGKKPNRAQFDLLIKERKNFIFGNVLETPEMAVPVRTRKQQMQIVAESGDQRV